MFENLLKLKSPWFYLHPRNMNETLNVSSPSFFIETLNSIFQHINMGVDYDLRPQQLLIGFCLFSCEIGRKWVWKNWGKKKRFCLVSGYCFRWWVRCSYTCLLLVFLLEFYQILFSNPKYHYTILRYWWF